MIAGMQVIPDFGFESNLIEKGENFKGWGLLKDFILADFKYERLENYI